MKIEIFFCVFLALFSCLSSQSISDYNVVWVTPSNTVEGTMPLGNGVTAANVWIETQNSKLSLYLSRQDAWDENAYLLRLTQVDIVISPTIGGNVRFNQTLDLASSTIFISISGNSALAIELRIWIDANGDNFVVEANSGSQFSVTVTVNPWRTKTISNFANQWYCQPRFIYPDVVQQTVTPIFPSDTVVFYHRNDPNLGTFFSNNMDAQGLGSIKNQVQNPLLNRQFGGAIYGTGLVRSSPTTLKSQNTRNSYTIIVTTHTSQTPTSDDWLNQLKNLMVPFTDIPAKRMQHETWWSNFWDRSHIYITPRSGLHTPEADDTYTVSQQYAIWRFLQACQGRSAFPIKFNGQVYMAQAGVDPDNRDWGGANWWQNARLSYYNMLISGDFDLLPSLFEYYLNMLPLARLRSPIYFNTTGAFFPETQVIFGTYYDTDYGCSGSRNNFPTSIPTTVWNRYNYQGGLDLSLLILDQFTYSQDQTSLRRYLPIATSVIEFYSGRWTKLDSKGKIIFYPSQAIETWQCGPYPPNEDVCVINDLPDIAGLYSVIPKLLALPQGFLSGDFITLCKSLLNRLPPIPTAPDGTFLAGEKLPKDTSNSENPELYVVHPYRLVTTETKQAAIKNYNNRKFKCNQGWCQDIMNAALLGLTTEAMSQVVDRAKTQPAPGYRFPGFMPRFQDFQPSADHLSNMNNALQWMLLQGDDTNNDVILFPAWPCNWNVDFKLRGPLSTIVEGRYVNGKMASFTVTPSSRTKNVRFAGCTSP